MAKGIKVVTLERSLPTPVTLHIGPHNKPIGALAGKFLVDKLGGKGNVVEIKGDPAVAPAIERHDGFAEAIKGIGPQGDRRDPRRLGPGKGAQVHGRHAAALRAGADPGGLRPQ